VFEVLILLCGKEWCDGVIYGVLNEVLYASGNKMLILRREGCV
jgi:hypothetical protein